MLSNQIGLANNESQQATLFPNQPETRNEAPLSSGGGVGGGVIHWHFRNELDDRKVPGSPWMENCIAAQIRVLLDRQTPVWSKKRDSSRPAHPGDVAVLCRTNYGCEAMAEALHRAGLKAAIARAGLLETKEGKLILACLKYLLNPSDALSTAEILTLTDTLNLDELVDNRLDYLVTLQEGWDPGSWATEHAFIGQLRELRPRIADLSASEILNLALDELDLRRIAARFGNAAQRLDNLDRMRYYALEYESACQRLHAAASLGGFLIWLDELARSGQDYQGSGESPDAVQVMTYHKSKGLEFPIAICHNLSQGLKEKVWGVNLVAEQPEPDLDDILGHRWLRFWVNPYGDQYRKTQLQETLEESAVWAEASQSAREEEARLLYVGLTRARDYLVFPTNTKGTPWLNRVFNQGNEKINTLEPDNDETPFIWKGRVIYCENEPLYMPKDFPEDQTVELTVPFHPPRAGKNHLDRLPFLIDLQADQPLGFEYSLGEPMPFSSWLEFKGEYDPAILRAVQTFLVADDPGLAEKRRLELAQQQLRIRGVEEALHAEAMLRHSEAFRKFTDTHFAPGRRLQKFPMEGPYGRRWIKTEADLLLENKETIVAFAFAGFAEGMKNWKEQARFAVRHCSWLHQLLPGAFSGREIQFWLVFALEGQIVKLQIK